MTQLDFGMPFYLHHNFALAMVQQNNENSFFHKTQDLTAPYFVQSSSQSLSVYQTYFFGSDLSPF